MKKVFSKALLATTFLVSISSYSATESEFRFVVKNNDIQIAAGASSQFEAIGVTATSLAEAKKKLEDTDKYSSIEIDAPIIMPVTTVKKTGFISEYPTNPDEDVYFKEPLFELQNYWNTPDVENKGLSDIRSAYDILTPKAIPIVGIIDGGFWDHPDISYLNGYSFVDIASEDETPGSQFLINGDINARETCNNSHGTSLAGIIAAKQNNQLGMAGIVNAQIIAARAISCDMGRMSAISKSIRWLSQDTVDNAKVIENPVSVINIGISGETECPLYLQEAIDYAVSKDILVVAQGGDHTDNATKFSPANCNGVIAVGAINKEGGDTDFSNYGKDIDASAMGVDVTTIGSDPDKYYMIDGTDASTAIVSGILSLGKTANPEITKAESDFLLLSSTSQFNENLDCTQNDCGTGVVNAKTFIQSINMNEGQLLSYITPALNNTEFCDKELYIPDDDEEAKKRLCALNEVVFSELGDDKDAVNYEVYRIDRESDEFVQAPVNEDPDAEVIAKEYTLADTDPEFLMVTSKNKTLVSTFNMDRYQYVFRICKVEEECSSEQLFVLSDRTGTKPDFCPSTTEM